MNNVNNSCNNEEEETKLIIISLLADMILKVLLMRQQHRLKLNRERVPRCRKGKRQVNTKEYMGKVREQKRKNRQACRSNDGNNEDLLESYEQINLAF
jgi:hypothetical protein